MDLQIRSVRSRYRGIVTYTKTKPVDLSCAVCGDRALFLSPTGALCPDDAVIDAAFNGWVPAAIRIEALIKRRDLDQPDPR